MRHKAWIISLFIAVCVLAAPSASFAETSKPVASVTEGASSRATPGQVNDDALARRETQAKDLEKLEGGNVVVIGASTGALILIIVLILILV